MVFSPNASPLAGREGQHLTSSKIGDRLAAEAETSVSLSVHPAGQGGEAFEVRARGELQLGLLIGGWQSFIGGRRIRGVAAPARESDGLHQGCSGFEKLWLIDGV